MGKQRTTKALDLSGNKYISPKTQAIKTRTTPFKPLGAGAPVVNTSHLSGAYDFGALPGRPMDEMRAQRQSNWDRSGNAVVRLFGSTALKSAQSVGYLAGLMGVDNKGKHGESWISGAADNFLVEWAEKQEQAVKDTFPIYKTKAYKNSSVFGNLTKPEFWTDDVVDGLAFMIQAQLQGMGVGMASRALGVGNKLTKALAGAKPLTGKEAQIRRIGDIATRSAFMTTTEAMFEAKGVRDAVLNEFEGQVNPKTGKIYTPEELTSFAAERAADAYSMNLLILAPSNYIEAGFLFKKLPSSSRAKDILLDRSGKVVKKNLKGFQKYADSYPGRVLAGIGKGGLTEGFWEENMQYSIEKINTAEARADEMSGDWYGRMHQKFGEAIPGLFDLGDTQRGKAVLLGSLIGSPMAVASNVREKLSRDRDINNFVGEINKQTEDLSSLFMREPNQEVTLRAEEGKYTKEVIYSSPDQDQTFEQPEPETLTRQEYEDIKAKNGEKYTIEGNVKVDEQGKPLFNLDAVDKYAGYLFNDSELQDLIDLELTTRQKQQKSAEVLQQKKLANWALAHFRAGAGNLAIQKLEQYRDAEPEAIAQFGYDPASVENPNELINKRIAQVKELQETYDSITLSMLPDGIGKKANEEFRERQTALYNLASTISAMRNVSQDLQRDKVSQQDVINQNPGLVLVNEAIAKYKAVENNINTLVQSGAKQSDINDALKEQEKASQEVINAKKVYNESLLENEKQKELEEAASAEFISDGFSPKLAKYHQTSIKLEEANDIITRSEKKFLDFIDPTQGAKNYAAYKRGVTGPANSRLPLEDNTSVSLYLEYEKGRIKSIKNTRKRRQILNDFFSFSLLDRIEKGEPVLQITKDLVGLRGEFESSPAAMASLVNVVNHRIGELDTWARDEDLQTYIELDEANRKQVFSEERIEQLDKVAKDAKDAKDANELDFLQAFVEPDNLDALTKSYRPETEDSLQRDVADEYIDLVENIKVPNFNNLPFVTRLLKDLTNLKRIFNERTDGVLSAPAFKNFLSTVDRSISEVEEVEREIKKKLREEEARLEKILFDQANTMFLGFGLDTEETAASNTITPAAGKEDLWNQILANVEDVEGIVKAAMNEGFTIVYADILGSKIADAAKNNKEFYTYLMKSADQTLNSVVDNDLDEGGFLGSVGKKENFKNRYSSNPRSEIAQLVKRAGNAIIDTTQPNYEIPRGLEDDSPVKKFFSHFNMAQMLRDLQDMAEPDERLERLARAHLRAEAAYNLKQTVRSRYRVSQGLRNELQSIALNNNLNKKDLGNPNPSNEQIAALRELQRWFMKEYLPKEYLDELDDQNSRFDNFAYFKAPAGAGKTNVVARWLKSILQIDSHQLIVGAKNLPAAKEIQKSLKPDESTIKTAEDILVELDNKQVTDELQLIILDEAGALNNAAVEGIADKVKEINDARDDSQLPIKVLIMGDPNQVVTAANYQTVGSKPIVPIEQYVGNGIKDAYHITRITPTTKRFRSPVEPIVDFQDMFIDQYYDLSHNAIDVRSTTLNPGEDTNPLFGVYGTSDFESQIKNILSNVDPETNDRSRVIITTPEQLEEYERKFKPFIEDGIVAVVDYENAQGLTIDEVYMDIPRGKGQEITTHNTEVYTAASRAKLFLMVKGFNLTNNQDVNIPQHAIDAMEIDKQVNDEYDTRVKSELEAVKTWYDEDVLDDLDLDDFGTTTVDPTVNPDPVQDDDDGQGPAGEEAFPIISGTEDISEEPSVTPAEPQPVYAGNSGDFVHKSKYSTNRHLTDIVIDDDTTIPAIQHGDDVYYVAARRDNNPLVLMMVPYTTDQGRKVWREVGSLRPQEELPEGLKPWFDEIKRSQLVNTTASVVNFSPLGDIGDTYTTKEDIEATYIDDQPKAAGARRVIAKGKVENMSPIKFNYDHKNPQPFKNKKELIDTVTEAFIKDMWELNYGKQGWTEDDRNKELANIRKHARVRIFTKKMIKAEKRGRDSDPTFNLKPGIPYVVIDNFKYPNSDTSTRSFYIQLAPQKMNFKDNISGLGTSVYNEMLNPIGKGTIAQKYQNAGLIPLVEEMEKQYIARGHSNITLGTKEFNTLTHALANGTEQVRAKELKIDFKPTPTMREIAKRIDDLLYVYEEKDIKGKKTKVAVPQGPAQKVLNSIARANLDSGDVLLRAAKQDANKKIYYTGKGIMPTNVSLRSDKSAPAKAFIELAVKRALRAGETQQQAEDRGKRIANMTQAGFTLEQLKSIFQHDGNFETTTKQGFGLRNPLHAVEFNNGKLKVENYVENTFKKVSRSVLDVRVDPLDPSDSGQSDLTTTVKQPSKSSQTATGLGSVFRKVTKTKLKTEEYIGGDMLTLDESYNYAKTMVPGLTRDQFKLVNDAQMLAITEGKEAWAAFSDNVIYMLENPTSRSIHARVVRHEVFHRVFHMNFTPTQRARLLTQAREEYGLWGQSDTDVEERLADEFMTWKEKRPEGVVAWLLDLFKRILSSVNFFASNKQAIDKVFRNIEKGKFSQPGKDAIGITRTKLVQDYAGDPQVYRRADNIMKTLINTMLVGLDPNDNYESYNQVEENDNGYVNIPVTFEEGLVGIYSQIPVEQEEQQLFSNTIEKAIFNRKSDAVVIVDGVKLTLTEANDQLLNSRLTEQAFAALSNLNSFNNYIAYVYNNKNLRLDGKGFATKVDHHDETNKSLTADEVDHSEDNADAKYSLSQAGLDEILGDGLQAHIKSSDEFNPEEKLSQRVKNYFSAIPYNENGGSTSFVPFRNAIVNLYKVMDNIVWSDLNFEKGTGTVFTNLKKLRGPKGRAIRSKITNLLNTATAPAVVPTFRFEAVNNGVIAMFDMTEYQEENENRVGKSIENMSFKELMEDNRNLMVVQLEEGSSTAEFFQTILDQKIPGMESGLAGMRQLTEAYRKYEASQILAETAASLGSMYKKEPKRGTYSSKVGSKQRRRYFKDQGRGTHKVSITSKLKNFVQTKYNLQNQGFISRRVTELLNKQNATFQEKNEAIVTFLKNVGIVRPEEPMHSVPRADVVYEDLKGLIASIKQIGTRHTFEGKKRKVTIDDVVWGSEGDFNNSSRFSHIANVIAENSIREVPSSYLRADGVKVYMYTPSSYAVETINKLAKVARLPVAYSFREFLSKYNPFLQNKGSVAELNFHSGIRNLDTGNFSIYKEENEEEFLERMFHNAFVAAINMQGATPHTYDQFFYVPGEKSNIHSATVPIRNDQELDALLETALRQEMARVNPKENKHYNVENYVDNWKKSYIAGVSEVSTDKTIQDNVDKAKTAMLAKSESSLDAFVRQMQGRRKTEVSVREMLDLYNKIQQFLPQDAKVKDPPSSARDVDRTTEEYREEWKTFLRPAWNLFYRNNYMNGHFLNQLIIGDQAYFKGPSDIVKRLDVFWAPGLRGITHNQHKDIFAAPTYKVGVMRDLSFKFSKEMWPEQPRIVGEKVESYTDAQGYFLPERRQELQKMYGTGMKNRSVLKPAFAALDNYGVPRTVKYSETELSADITDKLGELDILARSMRIAGLDEVVFETGFKVGKPNVVANVEKKSIVTSEMLEQRPYLEAMGIKVGQEYIEFPSQSVVELRNEDFRLQLNPVHHLDASTKNPSQITWMVNLRGDNAERQARMYQLMADHISNMRSKIMGALKLTGKNLGPESEARIRNMLAKNLQSIPGLEMQAELITEVDESGNYVMDLNAPFIAKKMAQQLSSVVTKNVVTIKYKGTNLVLQSAYGAEDLKFDPETGIAEVYLPDIYKGKFSENEVISSQLGELFAFRLPSTDIHSSITLRVKGFLPTEDNVVIAPKEIVFFHGSDYDVDKLYALRYQIQGDTDPYRVGATFAAKTLVNEKGEEIKKVGTLIGLDKEGKPLMVGDMKFADFIKEEIGRIRNEVNFDRDKGIDIEDSPKMQYLQQLQILYPIVIRNEIVSLFKESMTDKSVRDYLFSPINTERFTGKDGVISMLEGLNDKYKKEDRDMNDVMDQMAIRMDIASAEGAIGRTANFMKAAGHMFSATQDENYPTLAPGLEVQVDGGIYEGYNLWEQVWDGKKFKKTSISLPNKKRINPQIWETLDSMMQLALDNLKIQALNTMNFNNFTLNAYLSGVAMGIPAETVVLIMNQPVIAQNKFNTKRFSKLLEGRLGITEESKGVFSPDAMLTTDKLKAFIKADKNLADMSEEELRFQYNVLETFNRLDQAGKKVQSVAKFTNVLKEMPPNFYDLQDKLAVIDNMYKVNVTEFGQSRLQQDLAGQYVLRDKFEFPNVDVMRLPHLREAHEVLKMLKSVEEKTFKVNDPRLVRLSRRVAKIFDGNAFREEIGAHTTANNIQEKIRYEFLKYVLAGLEYTQDGVKVDFDTTNEAPFEYERDGEKHFVGGAEAWAQQFIQDVEEMQREEQKKNPDMGNHFILDLNIYADPAFASLKKLGLAELGQADPNIMEQYRLDFERLSNEDGTYTELQFNFLKYIVITQGLEWQASSYATILPPTIYAGLSRALDGELDTVFTRQEAEQVVDEDIEDTEPGQIIYKQKPAKIDKYKDHFEMQIASTFIRYMKRAPYSSETGSLFLEDNKTYESTPTGAVWDQKYKFVKGIVYPEFIKDYFSNNLLWKAYEPASDATAGEVIYQKVAFSTAHNYYQFARDIEENPYQKEDYLDSRVRTIESSNIQNDVIRVRRPGLKAGDQVFLKDYSDIARTRMVKATIAQVEAAKDNNWILTVKDKTEVTPPKQDNQFDSMGASTNSKALDFLLEKLRTQFAIEYEKVNLPNEMWAGRFRDGKVYINTAYAKLDTPFHEYLHPFIGMIKSQNREVYDKLTQELINDAYGQEVLARIRNSEKYQQTLAKEEDIIEEAMVTLVGELAANNLGKNTGGVLFDLLKGLAQRIVRAIRNLVGDVRVPGDILRPKNLLTTTTLKDLADVVSLSEIKIEAFDGQARDVIGIPKIVDGKLVYSNTRNFYADDKYSLVEQQVTNIEDFEGDVLNRLEYAMNRLGARLTPEEDQYTDSTGRSYTRLTEWIKKTFSDRPTQEDLADYSARNAFRRDRLDPEDPAATIEVKGVGEMNFDEYVEFKLDSYKLAAAQGRYMHLKVEALLATDPLKKREVELEMQLMRQQEDIDPRFSQWLDTRAFTDILSQLGVRVAHLDSTVDLNDQDKVVTEMPLVSETFGVGTRVDMLVEHSDGAVSIHDWKSGVGFYGDRNFVSGLLKHGEQYINIEDSNLDRAKLEVVLRAAMIKEAIPDVKFRNLNVAHLNRKNLVDIHGIELTSYLGLLKDYMYENNREGHDKLAELGIFDAKTYGAFVKQDVDIKEEDRRDNEDNVEYYSRKLQELQLAFPNAKSADPAEGGRDAELRKEMRYYAKRIQELQSTPGDFPATADEMDIGWLQRWMGNVYSVKNKFIQNYSQLLLKRKTGAAEEIANLEKDFKVKVQAVKDEYDASGGISSSVNRATNGWLAGYNYKDIFGFAWTYKDNKIDKQGWYMTDVNDPGLTAAQRDLLVFMKEKMQDTWKEVMHKEVPVYEGSAQPLYKMMGFQDEMETLEDDFMPRIFMGFQELWERHDGQAVNGAYVEKSKWMRPQAIMDHFFSKRKAQFLSDYKYVARGKGGAINTSFIPIKYLGSDEQIAAEDHTFDVQQAFTSFMTNMITKKHMDDMIGVAEGLKTHLTLLGDENNKSFKNSIGFIEDQVLGNILEARARNKYFTKPWTLPFTNGEYVIDPEQILMGLKTLTTWSSMWLKPVQGNANWLLIVMLNHKDALKGTVANAVGIEPEDIDYTMGDYKFGEAKWAELQKDKLMGNADNNKLFNISKKIRFLTDNYDYNIAREDALVTKAKLFRETNLYVFHQTGEEYGNYTLLAAQLRHTKNPATGKSLWESYDDEGNWTGGTRFKKIGSDNTTEAVEGLTSEEIIKMKRVTQRIHGSYRQEERSALELYALGSWVLQFKKYLPQLMMNLWSKKYQDKSLGAWKPVKGPDGKTVLKKNGETVYAWQERVSNGKVWVMLDLLNNLRKFRTIPWSQMDNETKQSVIDGLITLTIVTSWLVGTAGLPDEWKKHPLFVRIARIFREDIAQGANPTDLLRNLTNPVPVLTKMYNLASAFETWMLDGVVSGERTQDGRMPGGTQIRKQLPGFSTAVELEKYFGGTETINDARAMPATSWIFSQKPRER